MLRSSLQSSSACSSQPCILCKFNTVSRPIWTTAGMCRELGGVGDTRGRVKQYKCAADVGAFTLFGISGDLADIIKVDDFI